MPHVAGMAVESEYLGDVFAANPPSPWRSSKGTSRAGFRQMDPLRVSWHALSLRKGMLPPLEHETSKSPKGATWARSGLGRSGHASGGLWSVPRNDYHPSGSPPIAETKPNARLAEPRRVHGPPQRSKVLKGDAGFTRYPLSSCEV
jgi:hypothetical protein